VFDLQTNKYTERITFVVGLDDCLSDQFGYGSCNAGDSRDTKSGGECVDDVWFDGKYECECYTYRESNCARNPKPSAAGAVMGVVIAVLFLGFGSWTLYKHIQSLKPHDFAADLQRLMEAGFMVKYVGNESDGIVDPNAKSPTMPQELGRDRIQKLRKLGAGAFGDVFLGLYNPPQKNLPEIKVAIKTLKAGAVKEERDDLMKEAIVSVQFEHTNIVTAVGVVTSGSPAMLVLELCARGELQGILKDAANPNNPMEPLSKSHKRKYCHDIVKGMEYLAGLGFVHRDLAARNVLVDDKDNGKIADFGLARDKEEEEYYIAAEGKVPVRWTSPEAMKDRKFSEKSDVWAFGITCIEIWNDGAQPYTQYNNAMVMEKVLAEYKLGCPNAPKPFYKDVISPSLNFLKKDRPTFAELLAKVEERLADDVDTSNAPAYKPRRSAASYARRQAQASSDRMPPPLPNPDVQSEPIYDSDDGEEDGTKGKNKSSEPLYASDSDGDGEGGNSTPPPAPNRKVYESNECGDGIAAKAVVQLGAEMEGESTLDDDYLNIASIGIPQSASANVAANTPTVAAASVEDAYMVPVAGDTSVLQVQVHADAAEDAYMLPTALDLASKMNTPQPSQEDLARNLFASGNPDAAGNIHASAASALLSTSGLSNAILTGIWERAKRGSAPARSAMMNEAEFVCAHQLSVDAGGVFGLASHAAVDLAAETATATATATPAAAATSAATATPADAARNVFRSNLSEDGGSSNEGNVLKASTVSSILSKSGLSKEVLADIWNKAKAEGTTLGTMTEAEFVAAYQLAIEAGAHFDVGSAGAVAAVPAHIALGVVMEGVDPFDVQQDNTINTSSIESAAKKKGGRLSVANLFGRGTAKGTNSKAGIKKRNKRAGSQKTLMVTDLQHDAESNYSETSFGI